MFFVDRSLHTNEISICYCSVTMNVPYSEQAASCTQAIEKGGIETREEDEI